MRTSGLELSAAVSASNLPADNVADQRGIAEDIGRDAGEQIDRGDNDEKEDRNPDDDRRPNRP